MVRPSLTKLLKKGRVVSKLPPPVLFQTGSAPPRAKGTLKGTRSKKGTLGKSGTLRRDSKKSSTKGTLRRT